MKLKLIRIYRHMKYNNNISNKARQICKEILQTYPTLNFTLIVIDTLTSLSEKSLLDIPLQIDFLISIYYSDPRLQVKQLVLDNLNCLILRAPYSSIPLTFLKEIILNSHPHSLKKRALFLTRSLSKFNFNSLSFFSPYLFLLLSHKESSISHLASITLASFISHYSNGFSFFSFLFFDKIFNF